MTKQKTTKRALLISALAMLLSVTMLIGTTFAWFTDSVASGNNVITSGNLDIEVDYTLDGTTWNPLNDATNLFQKDLWEPGHTEVVALKIKNVGSLAFKYVVNMNIVSENIGKTNAGDDIVLSDILEVSTVLQQVGTIGDILLELAFTGENAGGIDYSEPVAFKSANVLIEDQSILPGAEQYLIIKVDMPETLGNEANHNGINVPAIQFDINVLATQYGYEEDTFGTDYDKDADNSVYVANVESFREALSEGGEVVLSKDVLVTDEDGSINAFPGYAKAYPAAVQIKKDTNIYLNEKDFAYVGSSSLYYLISVTDGATVNIYGDDTSVLSSTDPAGTNAIAANRNSVINIYGGTYTSKDVSVIDLNSGAVVNIYDGFFYAESYTGNGNQTNVLLNMTNGSNCTFNVYGGTYVNFDPRTAQDGQFVAAGYKVETETKANGEIWYTVVAE